MGCITSKVVAKSISFHKEMSHSLHRTTDGIPDLFTSSSIPTLDQPSSTETIDVWEFIAGLKQHPGKQEGQLEDPSLSSTFVVEKLGNYKLERSRSCHLMPENEMPIRVQKHIVDRFAGEELIWGSRDIVRSRSFHTVEEYDALVENFQLVGEPVKQLGGEHDSATEMQLQHPKRSSKKSYHPDYYPLKIKKATQPSSRDEESPVRENSTTDKTATGPRTREMLPRLSSSMSTEKSKTCEDDAREGSSISAKGLKRKAIAKGLESIQIPPTTNIPSVASLREWLHLGGQLYSPGAYVTPKFGSYNLLNPGSRKEHREECIFDPNLVAAFEERMQQLEAEEETILREIEQVLEKDRAKDATEVKEESSSNAPLDPESG